MIKNACNCVKNEEKAGIKWRNQTARGVENDSANAGGQLCKAAYAPFRTRAVTFGHAESLCARGEMTE